MNPTSRVVVILAIAAFASTSAFRVLDPAIPQLAEEFNVTTGRAGDGVMWFALAYGIAQFFYGPLGDRFGKFRVLTLATVASAAGSLVVALAPTFEMVLFGRFLSGATGAAIIPLALAWIGDHVPYEQRQATLSRFILGNIIGITSGLWIGGFFADVTGWRGAALFLVGLYLVVGALLYSQRKHVDEVPSAFAKIDFFQPLAEVFRTKWAWVILTAVMFEGALVFGSVAYVPAYLQYTYDISPTRAGVVTSLFAAGALTYVASAKWLIGSLGEFRMAMTGGAVLAVSYIIYLFGPTWQWALLAGALCGLGYYFLHAVLQARATQMVEHARATAVSMFACFMFVGQAVGIVLGSMLVDAFGLRALLWVSVVALPLLGIWFGLKLRQYMSQTQLRSQS
ncbi:MFS transporter [Orrella marina]|uniref:MFS transporter n=1 Tax=Orrella marina TaxID=2163011 RepID=A0A2R4XLH6_9BURK|nr:MFS transporter [Orrella marina]AWB34645.1 MFS transporter [Orrella marina]